MSAPVILIAAGSFLISLGISTILHSFVGLIIKKLTDNPFITFFVSTLAVMMGIFFFIMGLIMLIVPLIVL